MNRCHKCYKFCTFVCDQSTQVLVFIPFDAFQILTARFEKVVNMVALKVYYVDLLMDSAKNPDVSR